MQPRPHILLTEIMKIHDAGYESIVLDLAKAKEIVGLLEETAFRMMVKKEIEPDKNVLGGRFVLKNKHKGID